MVSEPDWYNNPWDHIPVISSETVTQFVARHQNGVFTNDIANRFGMDGKDARQLLKQLERDGILQSERDTAGGNGSFAGAGLVWKTKPRS